MRIRNLLAIAAVILVISCTRHPFVPPGNIIDFDSPSTVHKNEVALSGSFGSAGSIFDYGILSGWIRVKYGINDRLEAGIAGSFLYLADSVDTYIRYNPFSLGSYASLKYALLPRYISLAGGIGYGFSDLGNYTNGDIGIIAGFENSYAVPFIRLNTYIGVPINPKPHDLSEATESSGTDLYTPSLTSGFRVNGGIKLPVSSWLDKNNDQFSLSGIFGIATVSDQRATHQFIFCGGGFECRFPNRPCQE